MTFHDWLDLLVIAVFFAFTFVLERLERATVNLVRRFQRDDDDIPPIESYVCGCVKYLGWDRCSEHAFDDVRHDPIPTTITVYPPLRDAEPSA